MALADAATLTLGLLAVGAWAVWRLRGKAPLGVRVAAAALALALLWWAGETALAQLVAAAGPVDAVMVALAALGYVALVALGLECAARWPAARRLALLLPAAAVFLVGARVMATTNPASPGAEMAVALGAALVLAAALLGFSLVGRWRRGLPARTFAVLVPVALLAPLVLSVSGAPLGLPEAEHTWRVTFAPDGAEPWVARVPFVVPTTAPQPLEEANARSARAIERVRTAVHTAEGDASFTFVENESAVEVRGRGPVVVEGVARFFGRWEDQEVQVRLPDPEVRRGLEGPPTLRVVWTVRLFAGHWHSCGTYGTAEANVAPGGAADLEGPDMLPDGRGFSQACP